MPDAAPTGYNTPIPNSIMTPDRVETRLGELEFVDGVPTVDTTQRLFDNLDFSRAVEVFLQCLPAASMEAMRRGNAELGANACNRVLIADRLLDSDPMFLTGNTDTVYVSGFMDLAAEGPVVVEIPPGCGPGTVNDAWFRFRHRHGRSGPDRGQGGKYLILPPDHTGDVPDGYFVSTSTSYSNWIILRGFLVDGEPDAAINMFREGLRIYPLARAADPPAMEFVSFSRQQMNTIHANTVEFYEEIAPVIEREPIGVIDPETRGMLAAIGIPQGSTVRPRRPDAQAVDRCCRRRQRHRSRDLFPMA